MKRKKGKRIGLLIVMALLVAILAGLVIWLFTMDDAPKPQDQTQA